MGRIGPFELILILCIALIIFGPSKLPALAKSMGQAVKEFRKGTQDLTKDLETAVDPAAAPAAPAASAAPAAPAAAPKAEEVKPSETKA